MGCWLPGDTPQPLAGLRCGPVLRSLCVSVAACVVAGERSIAEPAFVGIVPQALGTLPFGQSGWSQDVHRAGL